MGSKLGLILSLSFIFFAFLFGTDLVLIEINYAELDSLSTIINYRISKTGKIPEDVLSLQEEKNFVISPLDTVTSGYETGDKFGYILTREYIPFVMGNETLQIKITRYTIIGVYNY